MVSALRTHDLTRWFDHRIAVDGVELEVPAGAIYGFLGPNGSGKTTTIRMILGLLKPDHGRIFVNGIDALAERRRAAATVGALLEAGSFYPNISGWQNLLLSARLLGFGDDEVGRVLSIVEMSGSAHRKVREYSLGMRQRLGIARALIGNPALLVLDEPTNGLDPDGIVDMRNFLQRLPDQTGATVFLSSHLLSEVEQIATHLGILSQGVLVAQGSLEEMQRGVQRQLLVETDAQEKAASIATRHGLSSVRGQPAAWLLPQDSEQGHDQLIAALNQALVAEGIGVHTLARQRVSLETFYRERTGTRKEEHAHAVGA